MKGCCCSEVPNFVFLCTPRRRCRAAPVLETCIPVCKIVKDSAKQAEPDTGVRLLQSWPDGAVQDCDVQHLVPCSPARVQLSARLKVMLARPLLADQGRYCTIVDKWLDTPGMGHTSFDLYCVKHSQSSLAESGTGPNTNGHWLACQLAQAKNVSSLQQYVYIVLFALMCPSRIRQPIVSL